MLEELIKRLQVLAEEYKVIRAQYTAPKTNPNPKAAPAPKEEPKTSNLDTKAPAPSPKISAPVGYKGKNLPADVLLVRQLLNKFGFGLAEVETYDLKLQTAIYDFQIKHCQMTTADLRETEQGRKFGWADQLISPSGSTWKTLSSGKSRGKVDESKFSPKQEPKPQSQPAKDEPSKNISVLITTYDIPYSVEIWTDVVKPKLLTNVENYHGITIKFPDFRQVYSLPTHTDQAGITVKNHKGEQIAFKNVKMRYNDTLTIEIKTAADVVEQYETFIKAKQWEGYPLAKALAYFTLKVNPVGRIADCIGNDRDIITGMRRSIGERVFGVVSGLVDLATLGKGSTAVKVVFALKGGIDLLAVGEVIPPNIADYAKDFVSLFNGGFAKDKLFDAVKEYAAEKIGEAALEQIFDKKTATIIVGFCKTVKTASKDWKKPEDVASNLADLRDAAGKVLDAAGLARSEENMREASEQIIKKYGIKTVK